MAVDGQHWAMIIEISRIVYEVLLVHMCGYKLPITEQIWLRKAQHRPIYRGVTFLTHPVYAGLVSELCSLMSF